MMRQDLRLCLTHIGKPLLQHATDARMQLQALTAQQCGVGGILDQSMFERERRTWRLFETPEVRSDASGTIGTLIGGRLDWVAFGEAAKRLLPKLLAEPIPYPSPANMPRPPEPALSIRLMRGLASMFDNDLVAAVVWWTGRDPELGGVPAEKVKTHEGYVEVVKFLEARAACQ
jgi:hypothetical protein